MIFKAIDANLFEIEIRNCDLPALVDATKISAIQVGSTVKSGDNSFEMFFLEIMFGAIRWYIECTDKKERDEMYFKITEFKKKCNAFNTSLKIRSAN